jgi:hypothetical protein
MARAYRTAASRSPNQANALPPAYGTSHHALRPDASRATPCTRIHVVAASNTVMLLAPSIAQNMDCCTAPAELAHIRTRNESGPGHVSQIFGASNGALNAGTACRQSAPAGGGERSSLPDHRGRIIAADTHACGLAQDLCGDASHPQSRTRNVPPVTPRTRGTFLCMARQVFPHRCSFPITTLSLRDVFSTRSNCRSVARRDRLLRILLSLVDDTKHNASVAERRVSVNGVIDHRNVSEHIRPQARMPIRHIQRQWR